MLINTVGVVLVAIVVGTNSGTNATDLSDVDTSGKEEAIRAREGEASPSSYEALVETLSKTIAANEAIFVREGSGGSSEELPEQVPPLGGKSSEEVVQRVLPVISSSDEIV